MSCEKCNGTGWVIGDSGARRCVDCRVKQEQRATGNGQIDKGSLAAAVRGLSVMAYFPSDPMAQTVIGDAVKAMCPSIDSLRYLVRRACELYRSWDKCGIPGLRQIVCTKFRPADGIESGPTDMFPEGIPSETGRNPLALPAGAARALPAGHVVTEDVESDTAVRLRALRNPMRPIAIPDTDRFGKTLKNALTAPVDRAPIPYAPPISAERRAELKKQIDAAVQANRDRKAREEAGL